MERAGQVPLTVLAAGAAAVAVATGLLFSADPGPMAAGARWALAGITGLSLPVLLLRREGRHGRLPVFPVLVSLLWALALAWVAVQAFNPTHELPVEQGGLLRPVPHVSWLPGTVSRAHTFGALALGGLAGAAFLTTRLAAGTGGLALRLFLRILVVAGVLSAVLCAAQRLEPRPFPVFERTGTFVNENQFAAAMNLLLPMALWLWSDARSVAQVDGRVSHPGPLYLVAAGALVAAVWLSGSRAGILLSVALCVGFFALAAWAGRSSTARPGPLLWVALLAVLTGAVWLGRATLAKEWETRKNLGSELAFRASLARATASIVAARPLSGSGAGTYAITFPYYQPESLPGHFRHAHCEPLQVAAELGLPGAALVAATLLAALRGRGPRTSGMAEGGLPVAHAARLALAGVCTHALIDFPFREPAILLSAALLLGVAGGHTRAMPEDA